MEKFKPGVVKNRVSQAILLRAGGQAVKPVPVYKGDGDQSLVAHVFQILMGLDLVHAQGLGNVVKLQQFPLPAQQVFDPGPEKFLGEDLRQGVVIGGGVGHVTGISSFPGPPQADPQNPAHPGDLEGVIQGLEPAPGLGIPGNGAQGRHGFHEALHRGHEAVRLGNVAVGQGGGRHRGASIAGVASGGSGR